VTKKVRIAITRALPAMIFVVVVGVALVGCGGEKELVRQDLSVIKPDKCNGVFCNSGAGVVAPKSDTKKGYRLIR